ncbi:MAG: hypothetical protein BRC36_08785 [Cyanobacteria bacterium QH_2_48_84]|nr:MAG: hypothetical protein BRC36_08785 [Cyanobacteria bacterium QH_2_48_84]
MLVRSETERNLSTNNRVLVPLDGSQRAEAIVPHVEEVAKLYEAKIILAQVIRSNYQTASYGDIEESVSNDLFNQVGKHQEIRQIRDAKQYLLDWSTKLRNQGFEVEANLLYGRPIESIIQVADNIDADLIAMTSHGQTGLDKVFYGSVSSSLLNQANRKKEKSMYKKILIPLDGSERAEAVIPHVENLVKHDETKVIFAQVVEPASRSAVLDSEKESEVQFKPQKVDKVKQYLTSWKNKFQAKGLSAEILLLSGVAVNAILHATEFTQADLLAMTRQGRTGLAKVFYGSVASGVFNRIKCPLLLVSSETEVNLLTNNRILVPLDGSKRAEAALPHAKGVAKLYNAQIILVRVVRTNYQTAVFDNLEQELDEEDVSEHIFRSLGKHQEVGRIKDARQYLLDWQASLQEEGFEVEATLLSGRPIEGIIQVAQETDADLIAMTSHGQTGLARVFYGDVASGLLNRAARPLLLIRTGETPVQNFA